MRAVFRILRLALGGEGRLGEVAGEQQSRQQEGGAQSGVEKRDEPVRGHAAGPQPDAAGHHHRHDDEGLHIEKLEEEVQLLLIGADAGCDRMLPVCEEKSRRSGSFRLHDDLQPVDDLTGFQFLQINDGDAQLGGPVAGGGVADLRGDDGRLGAFTAEAVPEDGQLVQGLRLDVAGLAA